MPFHFSLLCGIVGLAVVLSSTVYSQTAKVDPHQALEKAKDEYRLKLDEIEVKLLDALDQRIDFSRKMGDKLAIERVQAERAKFVAHGTLPVSIEKASQTFQRATVAARKKLELAYRSQIKEYVRRSEDEQAEFLQTELDDFLANRLTAFSPHELLKNGGCEEDLNVKNSPWVVVQGEWQRHSMTEIPAESGKTFFWPTRSPIGELVQEIDLKQFAIPIDARQLNFHFTGYVRTFESTTNDTSRIKLEFLDATKKTTLATFDSGEIVNVREWEKVRDIRPAMKGTRWVRVRLLSNRYDGSENNSYYDSLTLSLISANDETAKKVAK